MPLTWVLWFARKPIQDNLVPRAFPSKNEGKVLGTRLHLGASRVTREPHAKRDASARSHNWRACSQDIIRRSRETLAEAKEINRARRDSGPSFCLATSARSEERMVPVVQYQVQYKTIALSSIVSYQGGRRTQLMDRNITYVFVSWQIQNNPKNINTQRSCRLLSTAAVVMVSRRPEGDSSPTSPRTNFR